MTTTTDTGLDALRARYGEAFAARLPDHIQRLPWDAGRLAVHQRERLRALLACAIERSPFHARRLDGIDPGRFELADLARLPVMSKEQMMAGFDELATDRRLTRARTEQHLAASAEEPSLLASRYVCLASGGSSGLRGTFVQTIEEFAEFSASILRRLVARLAAAGPPPPGGVPVALVGAASPVHASGFAAAAAAAGYPVRAISAPATLPLAELVQRLNQVRPLVMMAHTSKLALLAGEQRAGLAGDRAGVGDRDGRVADRAEPGRDQRRLRDPADQPVHLDRRPGRPQRPGRRRDQLRQRHVHHRARRRRQPACPGRHAVGQGAPHQPVQPHPAADPLRADRPPHPPPGQPRPRLPARHRRGTRRRYLPLRRTSRSTRWSSAPSWSAPRPRWSTRSARPAAGLTSRSSASGRSTRRDWPPALERQPAGGGPARTRCARPGGARHRPTPRDRQGPPVHPAVTAAQPLGGTARLPGGMSLEVGNVRIRDRSLIRNRGSVRLPGWPRTAGTWPSPPAAATG